MTHADILATSQPFFPFIYLPLTPHVGHGPVTQATLQVFTLSLGMSACRYQLLKKLGAINGEDRYGEELYIKRGRQNVYVTNGSPCNEHLLPLVGNFNNGTLEYKGQ